MILGLLVVSSAYIFAISSLLLPVHGRAGLAFFERASEKLIVASEGEDLSLWVSAQLEIWRNEQRPSQRFADVVQSILYDADANPRSYTVQLNPGEVGTARCDACEVLARNYFRCVAAIMDEDGLQVDQARGIVSQSGVIIPHFPSKALISLS